MRVQRNLSAYVHRVVNKSPDYKVQVGQELQKSLPLFSCLVFFASLVILNQKAVRILLLDNIDSFTYNIFHYLEALGADVLVVDNQAIEPESLKAFDALVISPGPGLPQEAGKLMEVLAIAVSEKIPTLGVCLGMQAIAE